MYQPHDGLVEDETSQRDVSDK